MCGRFVIMDNGEIEEINKILQDIDNKYQGSGLSTKIGEIFPTDNVPILKLQAGKPSLSLMKWGFPKWDGKGVIINAKSETVTEKKLFSKAIAQRRCVILATGFYEWGKVEGKVKSKYQFNSPDSSMIYMAGIYRSDDEQEAEIPERFVILTKAANESISDIHDRMPVILYKDELIRWLTDDDFAAFVMKRDSTILNKGAV